MSRTTASHHVIFLNLKVLHKHHHLLFLKGQFTANCMFVLTQLKMEEKLEVVTLGPNHESIMKQEEEEGLILIFQKIC